LKTALLGPRRFGLWIFAGALAFNWSCLFVFPATPLWTGGDQSIWLADGERLFRGETLYRDFLQLTFPGTDVVYASMFRLFGLRTWIPDALLVIVGATLTWLIYLISRHVLSAKASLLPPLIFMTVVFHDLYDASHHWFSTLWCAAALAVVIGRRTARRLVFSGFFCGLATAFTQSHGVSFAAGLAVFLAIEEWQDHQSNYWRNLVAKCGALFAGFCLGVLPITSPFVIKAGLNNFVYCTLVFVARYFGKSQGGSDWRGYMTGLPARLDWLHPWHLAGFLLVHLLLPLAYIIALLRYVRGWGASNVETLRRVLMLTITGTFLFLSVASAPEWQRLYYVCFPALILFALFASSYRAIVNALLAATLFLAVGLPAAAQLHSHGRVFLNLPGGRTAFVDDAHADRYRWVMAQTHAQDYFWGGMYPDFYFLLDLRNPTTFPYLTADGFTRPEAVTAAIRGLEDRHVSIILWQSGLDLPAVRSEDSLGPLRSYVRSHYCVAKSFPEYEAWVRMDRGDVPCIGLPSSGRHPSPHF
jgi:hypothetical protein